MELAELKTALTDIRSTVLGFSDAVKVIEKRMDLFEVQGARPGGGFGGETKDLASLIASDGGFKNFSETGRGRVAIKVAGLQEILSRKTAVTVGGLGSYSPGVIMGSREPGIVPAALRTFRVRQLLRQIPSTAAAIDFVRVTGYTKASPQTEALDKTEATIGYEAASERMKTLAHWLPASRQALQDLSGLQESLNVHLLGGLLDEEDSQILAGAGTGENLTGLIHEATAFDTGLLIAGDGWEYLDVLAMAIGQLAAATHGVTGVVVNPRDWWKLVTTKDSTGRYILGDPATMTETRVWGVPVAVTAAQAQGAFLVGDFSTGAALYIKMDGIVEVSDSHSDYFIKNLLALRCEERVALCTYKPAAFVTGSFSQSPA